MTAAIVADSVTIARPAGVNDARWGALASVAELVVSGHAPWCTDHSIDEDEPGDRGYCRRSMETAAGTIHADIANGTMDGRIMIGVWMADDALTELTISQAEAVGHILIEAAQLARMGNLCSEAPEGLS